MKRRMTAKRNCGSGGGMIGSLENVVLSESPVYETCCGELREMQKHELICKISQLMGPSPTNIAMAEKIFDSIKFDLAQYIIHHEYNSPRGVSADLLLWLDSKVDPGKAKSVREFFCKYITRS
ncbi:MAG TPA: hypothetical protein PKY31_14385 [Spirochaetota bacterium]|nr:hypothetical protein [Spirochaetota bacterium]